MGGYEAREQFAPSVHPSPDKANFHQPPPKHREIYDHVLR